MPYHQIEKILLLCHLTTRYSVASITNCLWGNSRGYSDKVRVDWTCDLSELDRRSWSVVGRSTAGKENFTVDWQLMLPNSHLLPRTQTLRKVRIFNRPTKRNTGGQLSPCGHLADLYRHPEDTDSS